MAAVFAGAALSGCATTRVPDIEPEWVARIPPDRMGPVESARQEHRRAQDAVLRSRVAVDDAHRALSVQRSELDAANARVLAARKGLEAAEAKGDLTSVTQARADLARADEYLRMTRVRLDAEQQRIEYSEARRELAEAREVRTAAQVEQAEYEVLHNQGDLRVRNISREDFDRSINQLARKEQSLQRRVDQERAELEQRLNRPQNR